MTADYAAFLAEKRRLIGERTLIVAPLSVARQTARLASVDSF